MNEPLWSDLRHTKTLLRLSNAKKIRQNGLSWMEGGITNIILMKLEDQSFFPTTDDKV